MKKLVRNMFLLAMILTSTAYLPQALFSLYKGIPVTFSFTDSLSGITGIANYFRFGKDIVLLLTLVLILLYGGLFKQKINSRPMVMTITVFVLLTAMGILSLTFSQVFSSYMVVAGLRPLLFLLAPLLFQIYFDDDTFRSKLLEVLDIILAIQLFFCLLQLFMLRTIFGVLGIGTMRLLGTFGGSGNLATFALACGLYIYIMHFTVGKYSKWHYLIRQSAILLICILTGTRSCIMLMLVILLVSIYFDFIKGTTLNKRLDLGFVTLMTVILPLFLKLAESIAKRGGIVASQMEGGRLSLVFGYLDDCTVKEFLFGTGIGYGTNTAISLQGQFGIARLTSTIMDTAFGTVMVQYGMVVLGFLFIFILAMFFKLLDRYKDRYLLVLFIFVIFMIMMVSSNMFEQNAFNLVFIYAMGVLYKQARSGNKSQQTG